MISEEQAITIIKQNLPGSTIQKGPIIDGTYYLFSVYLDDVYGDLDPFYRVDKNTGAFGGFSITDNPGHYLDIFGLTHSSLTHHGIKGMRWGHRKQEPISPDRRQASIEAQKRLDSPVGVLAKMFIPKASLSQGAINVGLRIMQGEDVKKALTTTLTDPQFLAGLAVTTADSGSYRALNVKKSIAGKWKKDPSLAGPMSVKDLQKKVISGVNKDYPQLGTTNNCLRCSYTYEMRRRGYDVAATKTLLASGQTSIGQRRVIKGGRTDFRTKIKKPKSSSFFANLNRRPSEEQVFSTLAKQPNGSRGELQVTWGLGMGGHSVSYEIVNHKPVVIDNQSSKVYQTPNELSALTSRAKTFRYTRLDNRDLSNFALSSWIKDN